MPATADRFNALFDHFGEEIPRDALRNCRALYDAADEGTRFAFLVRAAGHLVLRLSEECADPAERAQQLLAGWFLA